MKNKNRIKIALMLPALAGGGAERVASELSRFFTREGYQVYIFTEKKRTGYQYEGEIVLLKPEIKWNLGLSDLNELLALASVIREKKKKYGIDVSISFMEKYNMANILSKGKDKVFVRICTILSADDSLKGFYYNRRVIQCLYNRADKVIVLSGYGKRDMVKNYGIREDKIAVIPNAAVYRNVKSDAQWTYGDKVILSVNRLHPVKQQGVMVDMMAEVIKQIPDAKLLLVGKNEEGYGRYIKRLIKEHHLEQHVILTGQVSDVAYFMNHSRVFVLTSVTEGFPNVVVEAMAQGLPIISINHPGPTASILGVNSGQGYGKYGIVVPMFCEKKRGDEYREGVRILSEAVSVVLTNETLHQTYVKRSLERAGYFRAEKIERLWKRLCDGA